MGKKIGFVTDSTADIPNDIIQRYAIQVIPAIITMGEQTYTDGIQISREDFYTRLPDLNPLPQTSAPSAGSFQEVYERLLSRGMDTVISIHPPPTLSGIYNAAWLAAREFGGRVHVLDGGQISLGLGFQVILAVEAARAGSSLENLLAYLEGLRKRVRVAALLDTIEYVRRSGRVSWALAAIGGFLHLQPLLEVRQGIVHRIGQARTRLQGIAHLYQVLNSWGPVERLAVLHTNAEAAARQLLEEVKNRVSVPPLFVNVTTVIGTHVGPNGLGFAAVPAS